MGDNRLNEAIQLAQKGKKHEARRLLVGIIRDEPRNEYAWMWLIEVCDSDDERLGILSHAVAANPQSSLLKKALHQLQAKSHPAAKPAPDEPRETPPEPEPQTEPPFDSDLDDLDWIEPEPEELESIAVTNDLDILALQSEAMLRNGGLREEPTPLAEDEAEELVEPPNILEALGMEEELEEEIEPEFELETEPTVFEEPAVEEAGEETPPAFVDVIQEVFEEAEKHKKSPRKRLGPLPKWVVKAVRVVFSAILLFLLVVAGRYYVDTYQLKDRAMGYLTFLHTPTPTPTIDPSKITPTPTIEPTMTPTTFSMADIEMTPTPAVTADLSKLFLGASDLVEISAQNSSQVQILNTFESQFPGMLNDDWMVYAEFSGEFIRLYDTRNWEHVLTLRGRAGDLFVAGDFQQDGEAFAALSTSMVVAYWDTNTGQEISRFQMPAEYDALMRAVPFRPEASLSEVVISPDLTTITAGFWGGAVVWDIRSKEVIFSEWMTPEALEASYLNDLPASYSVEYSGDGSQLVLGVQNRILLIDPRLAEISTVLEGSNVVDLRYLSENRLLAVSAATEAEPGWLKIWDLEAQNVFYQYKGLVNRKETTAPVYAISPDLEWLAIESDGECCWEVDVSIINLQTGKKVKQYYVDTYQSLHSMSFAPNSELLAIWLLKGFEEESSVVLLDMTAETGAAEPPLSTCDACKLDLSYGTGARRLEFAPNGKALMMISEGERLQILGVVE
ncbi:MAG: hypothetical protein JW750_12730 [Anaerolineaceae bacterium]|nr:hypothetical protein [Anaerolineaceae bacterium]